MSPKCAKFLGSTNVKDKDSVLRCSRCDIVVHVKCISTNDSLLDALKNCSVDASRQDILDKIDSNKNEMITRLEKLDEVNTQKVLTEVNEMKDRESNLMVFRLVESDNDRTDVMKILQHLVEDISEKDVLRTTRLGKKSDDVVRPLLIKLENAKIKNSIMRNVYNMKTIADKFAGVGLSDLTKEQRQEYKTFVEKAKSMQSDDKENFLYRVRGPVGRWKIIQFKKIHLNNCLSKNKVIKDLATDATKNKCNILLGLLNIRSVNSKSDIIYELIQEGLDIFVLVETWHGSTDNISVKSSIPSGYRYVDFLRLNDPRHGGIIVVFRSNFIYKLIELPVLTTFEAVAIKMVVNNKDFVLLALYRPGSAQVSSTFFDELIFVLENIIILSLNVMLVGDFNIHVEINKDRHTVNLIEVFEMFQLTNYINESTHVLGGTLDLVVTSHNFEITNIRSQQCRVEAQYIYIFEHLGTNTISI
ncbi:hypothetical protein HELRODRAFT_166735 [Helobdella robusta]|uniref:Endonuclease/exonuclease/phosphatase domain-containing protein n=1 Tax=Helobdella robusta TaxID=6412 RepID=T1EYG2_HELRO|nr:hypothetical protein HELRODRAFT_166735 [Helobdella robusta]ESO11717.1 hypothetical protein HELRODRAFT_166735 [Helobdella robusta]